MNLAQFLETAVSPPVAPARACAHPDGVGGRGAGPVRLGEGRGDGDALAAAGVEHRVVPERRHNATVAVEVPAAHARVRRTAHGAATWTWHLAPYHVT